MGPLAGFFEQLFAEGRVVVRDTPDDGASSCEAVQVLQTAYASYQLNVADRLLGLDAHHPGVQLLVGRAARLVLERFREAGACQH